MWNPLSAGPPLPAASASRHALLTCLCAVATTTAIASAPKGYYRFPELTGDTLVFAAEGDLWTVDIGGGLARRLTTHLGEESHPAVSPDGGTLAFAATYEGATEVYTMPLSGGLPSRQTWEREPSLPVAWTPDGRLVYSTSHFSTLPSAQLVAIDLELGTRSRLQLSEASDAAFSDDGETLFFTRPAFHNNNTKRYQGGTARQLWRFASEDAEAEKLTADFPGEHHSPMFVEGRLYFVCDRSGMMNLWSMQPSGGDLRQETHHQDWDVRTPAADGHRIVYQLGADLWLYDSRGGEPHRVDIELASDFDQLRERWVRDPLDYITSLDLSPEGDRVLVVSRGRAFVLPVKEGRTVRLDHGPGVRLRDARFLAEGQVLLLSDKSGEQEFWLLPSDGVGDAKALTADAETLRGAPLPSPDGHWYAFGDRNRDLYLRSLAGEQRQLNDLQEGAEALSWSPDSRYLIWARRAGNQFVQLMLYALDSEQSVPLTSDRSNGTAAAWEASGERLYFLADRHLSSLVESPWGPRQPEAYFDRRDKLYQLTLRPEVRPRFRPWDELTPKPPVLAHEGEDADEENVDEENVDDPAKALPKPIDIAFEGLSSRLWEVPLEAGNYRQLAANDEALFLLSRRSGADAKTNLVALPLGVKEPTRTGPPELLTLVEDVGSFRLSGDGRKLLLQKEKALYVIDAKPTAVTELEAKRVDLSHWSFPISTRDDYEQLFADAWRLERDYFYDPGMHGLDWQGIRAHYGALLPRVTTRAELSDLIGEMMSELEALHISVRGGDLRQGDDQVVTAALGARLERVPGRGYRIAHIYRTDPERPERRSPLADPYLAIDDGDWILGVNGSSLAGPRRLGELLRQQQGRQLLLEIEPAAGGDARQAIVTPIADERGLRYDEWEYTRRLEVESRSEGKIGYLHLRAMGGENLSEWYREFYPVFDRAGLIIDVRHNRGGNIDSLLLEKLLRRAWFYWQGRVGGPTWNMQYAFRGHLVVLCDQSTASDGEAFTEGFRRLGLGKVIGTRTWGGEIWLSNNNRLSDGGLARAPQTGVYGAEGKWLIEGWGVEPDIVVDNLPHETFLGRDRQLEVAIETLLELIDKEPRPVPPPPPYPDKSRGVASPSGGSR